MITAFFIVFFLIRLVSLSISIKNEKRLIAEGARQFGEKNSKLLAAAHIAYYFLALAEAHIRGVPFDRVSAFGAGITAFALVMLFYVIRSLGKIWTLKIYIHPHHEINRSWLFRNVKHPNYFLNVIPELIGIGILCHAWTTMLFGLPVYFIILGIRIKQEEEAMRHLW
ncbi:isoprenylcysteine carboxyl methyltransferase family protein [Neisseria weaveri]|uniref:isoprenylcysteine carboxyl methyltransferase family protein n=1 Tax=Neisseria weaveri TaxID=28091 RepID=UPI000D312F49|nr:isoprenylcysteine carboxyl methyltransferase family protein [Neisseria weaveri]